METILGSMSNFQWLRDITRRQENDVETGQPERFTLRVVRRITNDFLEGNLIGRGAFADVYKATLSTGKMVAIKRLKTISSRYELPTFKTEIKLLSRVHHKNLVNLLGFCREKKEEILVYEYISNGTLYEKLQGDSVGNRLDWMKRLKIALDTARGLSYLHNGANPPIIHRDIKSENILLDDTLGAKIADFGISKLIPDPAKSYLQATGSVGTPIYIDPEYVKTKKLDKRSDVYSFGVVMLELIGLELSFLMLERFRRSWEEANKSQRSFKDIMQIPLVVPNDQLASFDSFVELAFYCTKEQPMQRPRIFDVVKEIEGIMNKATNSKVGNSIAATQYYTAIE